jgi:hypothetical protein
MKRLSSSNRHGSHVTMPKPPLKQWHPSGRPAANSLQNNVVDETHGLCLSERPDQTSSASGYVRVQRSQLISSADVSRVFGKPPDWFGRYRNRKALEERGFPKSVVWGRWLRTAVEAWLEREGTRSAASRYRAAGSRVNLPSNL